MSSEKPGCGRIDWPDGPSTEWEAHTESCGKCRRDAAQIESLFGALLGPSPTLEARVLSAISDDLAAEAPADASWVSSLLLGATLAAMASILAASRGALFGEGTTVGVAFAGILWTGAFSVAIHALRHSKGGLWAGLALVVSVLAILALPTPSEHGVCAACEGMGLGLGAARAMFISAGMFVGIGLTSIMYRFVGSRWRGRPRAVLAGAVVLASVGPALLLACAPFSVGSLIGVLGGLVVGALLRASRLRVPIGAT